MKLNLFAAGAAAAVLAASPVAAAPDLNLANAINDQAFNHSQIPRTAEYLTDRIGGRMTNSPAMRLAERWTQDQFRGWGLANVHTEGFEFGRGWWIEQASVRMTAPRPLMLRAIPVAWTPATRGLLTAPVIVAPMSKVRDFAEWKGKLAGKIVLVTWPGPLGDLTEAPFRRYSGEDLTKTQPFSQPAFDPAALDRQIENRRFSRELDAFLKAEGAAAWARMSYRPGGLLHGEGNLFKVGQTPTVPGVELAAEDYRRLARLAKTGPVTLEVRSEVHYEDADTKAYNVFADIPGADPASGYVMAGAHLDSWVAADGATDNGAGSVVVMEAARILKTLGVTPRRTIRFALWSGEEQGLLGSAAYVEQHLAKRPPDPDPARQAMGPMVSHNTFPVTPLPGYRELAGYFNLDNGSGKVRGIYVEGNMAAAPILREWIGPYTNLGVTTVSAAPTGGTDHVLMARIGLPAYQFIQDPLDYGSTTHHSSVDTYDHLRIEDLKQAAAVMAWTLMQAADAKEPLPAGIVPTRPDATDPFAYPDPREK